MKDSWKQCENLAHSHMHIISSDILIRDFINHLSVGPGPADFYTVEQIKRVFGDKR